MIQDVKLPEVSDNVESGEVTKLLVSVGDQVKQDQALVELETDKAVIEVPAPAGGKVTEIVVAAGDTVKVGDTLLKLETEGEHAPSSPAPKPQPKKTEKTAGKTREESKPDTATKPESKPVEEAADTPSAKPASQPPPAAPSVRKKAREMGIDLQAVKGSGPGGRILADDLVQPAEAKPSEQAAGTDDEDRTTQEAPPAVAGSGEREPLSKIRRVTAQRMAQAWSTIPMVTHFDKADITELETFRKRYAKTVEKQGGKLTMTVILVRLLAAAVRHMPRFNASLDADAMELIHHPDCNIGVAVDTPNGLMVPVLRQADRKSLIEIAVELTELATAARERTIKPEALSGGTITLSNLGGIGGTAFTPIVLPPQVAILGVARGNAEAVYRDGTFQPRTMLPLALTYDHRVIDGADGARFVRWLAEALENPLLLELD